jgi:hypothetical protein
MPRVAVGIAHVGIVRHYGYADGLALGVASV